MTDLIKITLDDVREKVEPIVRNRGRDYVYPLGETVSGYAQCVYQKHGEPSCIVGHVLNALGVPVETLNMMDAPTTWQPLAAEQMGKTVIKTGWSGDAAIADWALFLPGLGVEIEDDAVRYLSVLQQRQDQGDFWGAALDAAESTVS